MATLSLKTTPDGFKPIVAPVAASTAPAKPAPTVEERPKFDALSRLPPDVRAAVEWIKATWPAAFAAPRLPIAIGAGETILAAKPEHIDARAVGRALRFLMQDPDYLDALATDGAMRFSLDGSPAGTISPQDRHSVSMNLHALALRAATKANAKKG